jgi:diacylglycerol kinase (ATP)
VDKVHVIVNPFSARGKTRERWHLIHEAIRSYFKEFHYVFTERPKQATHIVRELLQDGFDLIIGVGGDGTLNEISNGFFREHSPERINDDASLGIISSGTGSDFMRFMKVPRDFKKSVENIKCSKKRKIDVGKITFTDKHGARRRKDQYFINVADFGLGAEVIRNLSESDPLKRGPLTYYKGLLKTILHYRSKRVKITIDDREEMERELLIGAVANGRIFGGGMIIAPEAEADDGYFDLVLVENMKKLEIIRNSSRLYTGTIHTHPKVTVIKARNIKVRPAPGENETDAVGIEYDGEMGDMLPAEFSVIDRAINLRM